MIDIWPCPFFLYLIYMTWLIIIICSFRLIFKCEISFPISYNLENNRKNNDDITHQKHWLGWNYAPTLCLYTEDNGQQKKDAYK